MVQHTREKVLTERQFEQLLIGANRMEKHNDALEARALILIGGRLGLRPGETTHLAEDWVDRRRRMIHIPAHDPCTKGRGGGLCGYCKQRVEQNSETEAELEKLRKEYWNPKTPAAVREVPYHFSERVALAIEQLIETHGGWPHSFSTLQRRLDRALELAPELTTTSTSPHGLRATAASYHAGLGLDDAALQAMFGWRDLETANKYLSVNGAMTRRALSQVHSV